MEHKDVVDILAEHADRLNDGAEHGVREIEMHPEQRQELVSLLSLAEQVKGALTSVRPSPAYRRRLGLELAELARQRVSGSVRLSPAPSPKGLVIGAAIGSAVAGGILYLVHTYIQTRSQHGGRIQT